MMKHIIATLLMGNMLLSCQFSETMVIQEDGSGYMAINLDLSEMMAFGSEFEKDTTQVKQDTLIAFKDLLEEKKDSISKLPKREQERLNSLKDYFLQMKIDPDSNKMDISILSNFNNVNEANNLMAGFELSNGLIPNSSPNESAAPAPMDIIGVRYSFNKGKFIRDAFIQNKDKHKAELDSLKKSEPFLSSIAYKIKYTFPKKIKTAKAEGATFSLDGKTIELQTPFINYFKNPDILDIEIELEK